MTMRPFTINVPQPILDDLRDRLRNTRWPNEIQPKGWQKGTELHYMQQLTRYWIEEYDWRAVEANLNRFKHYLIKLNDLDIHYIHEKSPEAGAVPIVLLHGWAESFYSFIGLIDKLTAKKDNNAVAFHVVVPSLPGFSFSAAPAENQMSAGSSADVIARLMEVLGYERYVVHGGDWGAVVAQEIARNYADLVIGLHLTDIPFTNYFLVDRDKLSAAEKTFFEALEAWGTTEAGYVSIQSTKPLTVSYGLSDSPVGLAAWLIEHFYRYSHPMPTSADLITNVMLYWLTNSIRSSIRLYNEGLGEDWGSQGESESTSASHDPESEWNGEAGLKLRVPTAIAKFPHNLASPPRELAERFFDVVRFTEMEQGGHFAAIDEPILLQEDIRAFVANLAK